VRSAAPRAQGACRLGIGPDDPLLADVADRCAANSACAARMAGSAAADIVAASREFPGRNARCAAEDTDIKPRAPIGRGRGSGSSDRLSPPSMRHALRTRAPFLAVLAALLLMGWVALPGEPAGPAPVRPAPPHARAASSAPAPATGRGAAPTTPDPCTEALEDEAQESGLAEPPPLPREDEPESRLEGDLLPPRRKH